MTDESELLAGIGLALGETLGREIVDLTPGTRLLGDLGLDSLDLLDLVFRLERRFKVRLNPKDFELRAKAALGEEPMIVEGLYTPRAVEELKRAMPCVPAEEFEGGLQAASLFGLFRVATLMRLIEAARPGREPAGGRD